MLKKDKDFISVSIGEEDLRLAHFTGSLPNLKAVNFVREDLSGIESNQWHEKIDAAVKSFGIKKSVRAVCVISPDIVTTKNIEIPSLDQEEIRSIIDLQAGRHTPYSREEILIGYVSIGVFQRNYTKVLLVIANRQAIRSRLEACELAGMSIEKVLFSPECVAVFYAKMLNIESTDDPIGIINLNYSTTDFIVEHNQTVATCRSIPLGMKNLLSGDQGEKDRLVSEVLQSLEIYNNEDINQPPSKYILTVDTPITQDLQKDLQEKLQKDVSIMTFDQIITSDTLSSASKEVREGDSFAPLVSAAHFVSENLQVDMMPDEIRNQRSIEEQGRQVILAGIFSMILLLLICGMFFVKIYFRNIYLEKVKQEFVINQFLVTQLDKISHRTRIVKDYLTTRMVSLDVVEEIYRLVPEQMYLQNIFMDEYGVINIQGISESMSMVFNVVKALEDSDLFKEVTTRSTTAKKDRGKDAAAFDIVFKLESAPDGPIGEIAAEEQEGAS